MGLRGFGGGGALLWVVAGAMLGCSSSDPANGSGGAGGSSGGASGSAGTSNAGTGDASAGSASAGAPAAAFNPALPAPSYDCRSDINATSKSCISLTGTAAGMAFEDHCADPLSPNGLLLSPPAWPTGCGSDPLHRLYNVDVPVQDPGLFHYTQMPNGPKGRTCSSPSTTQAATAPRATS
jgi:hypothetical protein